MNTTTDYLYKFKYYYSLHCSGIRIKIFKFSQSSCKSKEHCRDGDKEEQCLRYNQEGNITNGNRRVLPDIRSLELRLNRFYLYSN